MNNQQKITEFGQSGEQNNALKSGDESDEFGWGSFGKPPEDWPVSRIKELFEIQKDSADPDKLNNEKLVRLYSMPAFDDGEEPELTKAGDIGSKKFHVPNQSLLFSKLNISKKRFWLVDHSHNEPALCSTEYWPMLPANGLNLEFYLQYFNSDSFINRPRLSTSSTTNSHQRIKSNLFDKVRLPVPPLSEQRKIASVLYTVDRAIRKTTEIIDRTERVREGVTQDILTKGYYNHSNYSDIRLGPVKTSAPDVWSIKNIPDYFDIIDGDRGKNYPSGSDFSNQGHCLFMSATNVTEEGLKFDETEFITRKKDEELRNGKLKRGDLIMTTRGTVGNFGLYDESVDYDNIRINSGMVILRPKENISSVEYYYHLFRSGIFQRQINATSYGTAQPQISVTDIKKMGVLEPGQDEKEKISELIKDLVSKIRIQKEYRNQLQSMKRGLMQDLLSGKVRTTDTNIQVPDEVAQYG